jgi:hypothetical protein
VRTKLLILSIIAPALSVTASEINAAQISGRLANKFIAWNWQVADGQLHPVSVEDKLNGGAIALDGDCFQVMLGDGTVLKSSNLDLLAPPKIEPLAEEKASPIAAMHDPGRQLVVKYSAPAENLVFEWRVMLRRHSSYIREELSLKPIRGSVLVKKVVLFNQKIPGAKTAGTVDGSPVVAGNFFIGYEHPMARNTVDSNSVVCCGFLRNAILEEGETLRQSSVIGIASAGQMRRGFLAYLERERAHPYRPFLHYNSWYDISWVDRKYDEGQCRNVIDEFGRELARRRGVSLNSFLFDDGWDDNQTLWQFNSGFPNGFTPVKNEAAKFHSGIGVWISPFGGYAQAKEQRLNYASRFEYETNAYGFSLAGPNYYRRFHDICLEMIRKYGVNQFKFDGLAAGAKANEAGLTRDGDAMFRLIADLRAAEPNIYINQTTGTWPSPFWLLYVDSTWRGGYDHSFAGEGSWCQKWMTYRDEQTYQNVVKRAPLYPLNSIMLHGIIYAAHAEYLNHMIDADFAGEVREFFGNGTQLQEMYITPDLLDKQNWDDLAEAAKWSRENADVLMDTHWIGGDPGKGEIYGWASWSPRKAIITLRNPSDAWQEFAADPAELLQLPQIAKRVFRMRSPWIADRQEPDVIVRAGETLHFKLAPFQVLVLESK